MPMAIERVLANSEDLISAMRTRGFSESYVKSVRTELRWPAGHACAHRTLEDACMSRTEEVGEDTARKVRSIYGLIRAFDLAGRCPSPGEGHVMFERGARLGLRDEFLEVISSFRSDATSRGLRDSTINGCVTSASTFFVALQGMGGSSLAGVTERDVVFLFIGDGALPSSWSYRENVSLVLSAELGELGEDARRVRSFLPPARRSRKNIQYLTEGEDARRVRSALARDDSGLCLRDRAMGWLLLLTGLRACDVAGMLTASLAWESDEIRIVQRKTGAPLTLPLLPVIGNALLDYLELERPDSVDPHLFLSRRPPHGPIGSTCVSDAASRVYDAAGVRTEAGDRRGTHLFRHNAATRMVDAGVPRAVVSATLGHADPGSLDRYLAADVERLRSCALDVGGFPVREGVLCG